MKQHLLLTFSIFLLSFNSLLSQSFTSNWNTTLPGTSDDNSIEIPTNPDPAFAYNYTVDWGDGITNTGVTGNISHTYATSGMQTITISGDFPAIYFNDTGDRRKITQITSWGNIEWKSMENAFFGCQNLNFDAIAAPDLSQVTSLRNMFKGAIVFNGILNDWNLSNVTDIAGMFEDCTIFNRPLDAWLTSSITDMSDTFNDARNFNEPLDNWNTSAVVSMARMFRSANDFNQNINSWNVGLVTDMSEMFFSSDIAFPLNNWNVLQVTTMRDMFNNTPFNQPLNEWDVDNVTDMHEMFRSTPFNQDISSWDVENVTDMSGMFERNNAFNQPLNSWNVSNVTNMNNMFAGIFSSITAFDQPLDLWITSSVTDMSDMFESSSFNHPIGGWDVSAVTNMAGMFDRATDFNQPIESWFVDNVTNMSEMFEDSLMFDQPLDGWNVSSVTNFASMFNNAAVFNQPLDNWSFGPNISMNRMFINANAFDQNLGLWDITTVNNVGQMLDNSGLSEANYNATLVGWAAQDVIDNLTLGAASLLYCDGRFARQDLIDNQGWTINDDVFNCSFVLCTDIISPVDGDINVPTNFSLVWEEVMVATGYRLTVTKDTGGTITTLLDDVDVGNVTLYDFPVDFVPGDIVTALVVPFNAEGPAENCVIETYTIVESWVNSLDAYKITINTALIENGSTAANQYRFTRNTAYSYDYSVDWGDDQFNNNVTSNITHTYETPGVYTISIIGNFPAQVNGFTNSDAGKLLTIDQWGSIPWLSMSNAYQDCRLMTYNATDTPDLSQVTSMSGMYSSCSLFNGNMNNWNVSNVSNFSNLLLAALEYDQPMDLWDVSNATNMAGMFLIATKFDQPIGNWNVSNVTNMSRMFDGFTQDMAFNHSINDWNVDNVTNMFAMFRRGGLFNKPLDNWNVENVINLESMFEFSLDFNQNIEGWNVSNVETMESMFQGASAYDQPLNDWNVINVTSMESMFESTLNFNQSLAGWETDSCLTMASMFENAQTFDQPIGNWNVSTVTNMISMFERSVVFNQDISQWNVSQVTNMTSMFEGALLFDQPIADWEVDSVVNMTSMFENAQVFNQPIGNWDVSAVANMTAMFQNAQLFDQPIDNWNVSSVTLMESMFENAQVFNQNINDWDVANVTNFKAMFKTAQLFNMPLNDWLTDKAQNTSEMFQEAAVFNQNIDTWNTSFVTTMEAMFKDATAYNQPLGSWNTASVTTMEEMFSGATLFNQNIDPWNTRDVLTMEEMFDDAIAFDEPLNNWRVSQVTNMNSMFRNATSFNQFLNEWNIGQVSMENMFEDAIAYDRYLGDWDMSGVIDLNDMLDRSGMSRMNYDNTLIAWAEQSLPSGLNLGAQNVPYCDAFEERADIIATYGWNFSGDVLDCPIPLCTQLISPFDGEINVPVNTNLTWDPAVFARGYRLTVTSVPPNVNNVTNITLIDETNYNFSNDFAGGEVVTVTIIPFNNAGDPGTCISEVFTIITEPTPTLPECTTLLNPIPDAMDVPVGTDLSWEPVSNADGYKISVGITTGGVEVLDEFPVGNVTTFNLVNDLPENTLIYVTTTPTNEVGDALNCDEQSFMTEFIPVPPGCISINSPVDEAVGVLLDADLFWDAVDTATGYLLTVGTTPDGIEILNEVDVLNTLTYDFGPDLDPGETYYVTVTPYNGVGDAIDCDETSFTTETPSNVIAMCIDFTAQLDATGSVTIIPANVDGGSSDPDGPVTLSLDIDTFDCSNLGANTVTLTVTDNENNSATCQTTVTVEDNIAPVLVCQDLTVEIGPDGTTFVSNGEFLESFTDNCDQNLDPGTGGVIYGCANIGSTFTKTTSITDENGNTGSCISTITVVDVLAPITVCQNISVTLDSNNMATITANQIDNNSTDNCGVGSIAIDIDTFDCSNIGDNMVTLTVTDIHGNSSMCTATVTVIDDQAPAIMCPEDIAENVGDNCLFTIPDYSGLATVNDNCGNVTITQVPAIGTTVGLGISQITITADDGTNMSSCSFNINVSDTTNPIASCVAPFSVSLDINGMASISATDIDNGSTDNCSISSTTIDITDFTCDNLGENTVTLTITDASGNMETCTTIVTVDDPFFTCNEPPVAMCNAVTVSADAACMGDAVALEFNDGSSDPEGETLTFTVSPEGPYPLGLTNVTLTVSDGVLTNTCDTTITVVDDTPPTLTCVDNQTVDADSFCTFTIPDYTALVTASDNCNTLTLTQNPIEGTIIVAGTTSVIITANDGTNETTCSFDVIVNDTTTPTAVCQNITVQLDAFGSVTIVANDVDGGSTDTCGNITTSIDIDTFDCSNIGSNIVTLTVMDDAGLTSTCTATIIVEDIEIPVAICQNITIQLDDSGMSSITSADIDAGSTDNCGIDTVEIDINTFDCSSLGDNTVTLLVTDSNGNTNSCIAIVTVEDIIAPIASCQSITIQLDEMGMATITPQDIDNGSTDNCDTATLVLDIDTFNCGDVGDNQVTLTITDASGNQDSCIAMVTVEDTTAPIVICQNLTFEINEDGDPIIITPAMIDGGSTDNCTIASLEIDITTFDCSNVGDNDVQLTVTDTSGNVDFCIAVVTINATSAVPVAMCQNVTVVLDENGMAMITPQNISSNEANDICGNTLTLDIDTFTCDNAGEIIPVTLTVTNALGESASCVANVFVVDSIAPTITCPEDVVIIAGLTPYELPDFIENGTVIIEDNCSSQLVITQDPAVGTFVEEGETEITITITDPSGNMASCEFDIFVDPTLSNDTSEILRTLKLFPNPTVSSFSLSKPDTLSIENITILDVSGRKIKNFSVSEIQENYYSVSEMASATYFVFIETNLGVHSMQLIKE